MDTQITIIMDDRYTCPIFIHSAVVVDTVNNYKSIKAKDDIDENQLILIEHVFTGSVKTCQFLVANNEYLYDELYPRTTKWKDDSEENRYQQAYIKLNRNSFFSDIVNGEQEIIFGDTVSKMNHSCYPNCAVQALYTCKLNNMNVKFIVVYSINSIKKSEELTFMYDFESRAHGKEDDFQCQCQLSLVERKNKWFETQERMNFLKVKDRDMHHQLVKSYLDSIRSRIILINQYLAKQIGYVMSNTDEVKLTLSFKQLIEKDFSGASFEEKVAKMIKKVSESFALKLGD